MDTSAKRVGWKTDEIGSSIQADESDRKRGVGLSDWPTACKDDYIARDGSHTATRQRACRATVWGETTRRCLPPRLETDRIRPSPNQTRSTSDSRFLCVAYVFVVEHPKRAHPSVPFRSALPVHRKGGYSDG